MKKHFWPVLLLTVALLASLSLPAAAADEETLTELSETLNSINVMMNNLLAQGFTIEHLELDTIGLGEAYPIPYRFSPGWEYVIVAVGGPALADLDLYVFTENRELVFGDDAVSRAASIIFKLDELTVYHAVAHAVELEEGYREDLPYYFAVIIAAR